ncbi:MAG: biosynthetic arginine decarboxylase [Spirulinaceae cyanobacterium]
MWSIEDSQKLYRIQSWGEPYFSINSTGHVIVSPQGDSSQVLDLWELVQSLQERDIELPLLIRFPDILADRIERLNTCFAKAIARYNYPNTYRGVYPIKCNQHRYLVEDLVRFGKPYQFGLEAGSKPELTIALATLEPSEALLICNGYKDHAYLETALLAKRLGQNPVIVIEQQSELALVLEISQKLNIAPTLGVRAKLNSRGSGHWGNSTGDGAKCGLTIPQILEVVTQLDKAEMLSCLQLLHFHIGSQISSISVIKDAIREASQIYGELVKLGANMQYLDVGGGLGVDYDGSKTNFPGSKNYNMQNYANDIVAEVSEVCEERNIAAPILISESGRAIASHQAVLIFDVLDTSDIPSQPPQVLSSKEHLIIRNLWETYHGINLDNYQESYHDAIQFKEEAISLFGFGYLGLEERARAEQLYWACCEKIFQIVKDQEYIPEDLQDLAKSLASIYHVNFSVFRSAPDAWAINQLFPIMPLHRLEEKPTKKGFLADLTCDSDGKIDQFIDTQKPKNLLELHPLKNNSQYCLGMFLVGAYQEIMGNLHNLFGSTNLVHIKMTSQGYEVERVVKGDGIAEVLSYVEYDAQDLVEKIRQRTEKALQEKKITLAESRLLLQNYESSLNSYTYLNS